MSSCRATNANGLGSVPTAWIQEWRSRVAPRTNEANANPLLAQECKDPACSDAGNFHIHYVEQPDGSFEACSNATETADIKFASYRVDSPEVKWIRKIGQLRANGVNIDALLEVRVDKVQGKRAFQVGDRIRYNDRGTIKALPTRPGGRAVIQWDGYGLEDDETTLESLEHDEPRTDYPEVEKIEDWFVRLQEAWARLDWPGVTRVFCEMGSILGDRCSAKASSEFVGHGCFDHENDAPCDDGGGRHDWTVWCRNCGEVDDHRLKRNIIQGSDCHPSCVTIGSSSLGVPPQTSHAPDCPRRDKKP